MSSSRARCWIVRIRPEISVTNAIDSADSGSKITMGVSTVSTPAARPLPWSRRRRLRLTG